MYDRIRFFLPDGIQLLSQGEIVAKSLVEYLSRHPKMAEKCTKTGDLQFFTTDDTTDFDQHAARFFGSPVASKHLDLSGK
jgi:glutamate racemase